MFDQHQHSTTGLLQEHSGTGDNVARDKIVNIYVNAKDYKRLEQELSDLQQNREKLVERIRKYPDDAEFQEDLIKCNRKIADTWKEIEDFKADVFRLHELFTRIPINTERLRRAKEHFDKGEFREADAVLKAEDIQRDVEQLKAVERATEDKLATVRQDLEGRANEYLLKAQLALLSSPPEGSSKFEMADGWFEQALATARTAEVLHEYALFLWKHNAFRRAEPLCQDALKIRRSLAEADSETFLPKVADTLNNLAVLHGEIQAYDLARKEHGEALKIRRSLAEASPELFFPNVAETLNNLAILHKVRRAYDLALAEYQEALELYRCLAEAKPEAFLPKVAMTLNNMATLYQTRQEYSTALIKYEEALEIRRSLAETAPETFLPNVAETLSNLALLHRANQDYGTALAECEEALEIYRSLAKSNPEAFLPYLAVMLNNQANLHVAMLNYGPALTEYEEALKMNRRLGEVEPKAFLPKIAMVLNNLALLHAEIQDYSPALTEHEEALKIRRSLAKAEPKAFFPDLAQTLFNLSLFHLYAVPDKEKSIAFAQEARTILIPLCKQAPHLQGKLDKVERVLKANAAKPDA